MKAFYSKIPNPNFCPQPQTRPSRMITLLWAMPDTLSIDTSIPLSIICCILEYLSDRLLLSRRILTFTPLLWAATNSPTISFEVMPYACRYTDSLACDIRLLITLAHPVGGVKHRLISLEPTRAGSESEDSLISLFAIKGLMLS